MKNIINHAVVLILAVSISAIAKDEDVTLTEEERAVVQEIMANTKLNMVVASDIEGVANNYQSDGDPLTLEIVMLKKGEGVDRVSDDGEVIFVHEKTRDKTLEKFFTQAFYLRARRIIAEKNQSSQDANSSDR